MGNRNGPSRRAAVLGILILGLMLALALPSIASAAGLLPVYRFFNLKTGTHFYTSSETERADVQARLSATYRFEGVAYTIDTDNPLNNAPLYRFFNLKNGTHFYTASATERDGLVSGFSSTYRFEGTAYLVSLNPAGTNPVWRFYNAKKSSHFYTANEAEKNNVVATLAKVLRFEGVAFYFAGPTIVPPVVPGSHATPNISCTAVGCHVGDLASIHIARGCAMCHANGVTPESDCLLCHSSEPHGAHTPILSVPVPGGQNCTAVCHTASPTDIGGVHPNCGTCHANGSSTVRQAIEDGGATCETCHTSDFAVIHPIAAGSHTVSGSCFTADCHFYTDISLIHTKGDDPPGCFVCHAVPGQAPGPGVFASLNCVTCHPNLVDFHSFVHLDASGTAPLMKSSACTACHGTDLPTAHQVLPTGEPLNLGCFCHTSSNGFSMAGLMSPLLAAGYGECVDCHKGTHAPHDFSNTASGHSTTTFGKKGVYTKFDGSQGVTLTDTEGDTVTTDWDFPEVNVFWGASDPAAPATAIKGLTKDSVVTCQDCHTGLNAAGPHGAAENWGIDPNYPYPFRYAILGGGAGANSATDYSLNVKAAGSSQTTGAATPATTTAGIPASASGIKARIASNLSTSTNAPVQIKSTDPADLMITNYNNYPDTKGAEYIADATSGTYAVICAKCHDLYNPVPLTTTQTDNGWGNAGPDSWEGMHGAHAGGTARNGNDVGRIDGRSDCASCHVAVPHAWRQPRLLVNGFTGNYYIGGGWISGVLDPGTPVASVADPLPYFQGRGMPFSTGVGALAPAPDVSPGNGPNDAKDNHAFNAFGKPVWEEAACISCSGANTGTALEHRGITSEPAKIQ